ncbi:DMT family transporter [Phenylobacterium immobile]|uniref:DMT family transporter n=1 Tax=Phenylobacterium immobile TaxID=21 RepID=UPI000A81A24B|nr:DMT family transporter [Phenylobacterium immobile]
MPVRDFVLLVGVCILWASNNVVSKYAISVLGVAPMAYAALRFVLVAVLTFRWLLPAPRPYWRLALVGVLMGAGNFGLFFLGMKDATVASAAIVAQAGVPVSAIFSMLLLQERISRWRAFGIVLTLAGTLAIVWDGGQLALSPGLLFIAGGASMGALAGVLIKTIEGVSPLQLQAWVSFCSLWPLLSISAVMEPGAWHEGVWTHWQVWACVAYSGVFASLIAHTVFYGLIQRHEATVIMPLTLMMPMFAVVMGVIFFGEALSPRLLIGATVVLLGVLFIVLRRNQMAALMAAMRNPGTAP